MTPAINRAKQAKIAFTIHEYEHDPAAQSYGMEAAQKMGVAPERVYKTLVAADGRDLYVAVVPVMLAKAVGAKKMAMADVAVVERVTGYVVGGVSPLGQKKRLRTVMDASARDHETIFVSAGRRGMEIELSPQDLAALTGAAFAPLAR
jgi:Cys-tRNA(Pro)/Cys-tRNA(Cys) deacylase